MSEPFCLDSCFTSHNDHFFIGVLLEVGGD